MSEDFTEAELYRLSVNAAVHKSENFILDLGTTDEFGVVDAFDAHEVLWQIRDGHMVIFCATCEKAGKERMEGVDA